MILSERGRYECALYMFRASCNLPDHAGQFVAIAYQLVFENNSLRAVRKEIGVQIRRRRFVAIVCTEDLQFVHQVRPRNK